MAHLTNRHSTPTRSKPRRGAATVELSLLLPLLLFLFVAAMDYSRVFYASVIVANCARNGAMYASDPNLADRSLYVSLQEAVEADASDLTQPLTVSTQEGSDARGYDWVEVTVKYPFRTVLTYPGIPSQVEIVRTVHMRKLPVDDSAD